MNQHALWKRLATVHDPEVPCVSIVDLGLVVSITVTADAAHVVLRPTFIGCPALDWIGQRVRQALYPMTSFVEYDLGRPWTTDDISRTGREQLRAFGIAPPGETDTCPFCGSRDTHRESLFGGQLCRASYYCQSCHQPFSAWKSI